MQQSEQIGSQTSELEQFAEYMKEMRRKSNYKFRLNMEELQTERLTQHVRLDPENDRPLPDWAKNILNASHLSKRTRLCLLRFHNRKIRERRLAIASPSSVNVN